jgi:hypothetical protein
MIRPLLSQVMSTLHIDLPIIVTITVSTTYRATHYGDANC